MAVEYGAITYRNTTVTYVSDKPHLRFLIIKRPQLNQGRPVSTSIETIFPNQGERLRSLRNADADFEEICAHFEMLLGEAAHRFGTIDDATSDLIASFDDLRREIEKRLSAPAREKSDRR